VRVFVSSTKRDLGDERDAVCSELEDAYDVVRMERFGSRGDDALETCLEEIATCDAVLVILGHQYGSIAPRLGLSYTEAEYERARECEIEVLAYVKSGFDEALDNADHPSRLKDFRDSLEDAHTVHRPYFRDPLELAERARLDLGRYFNAPTRRPMFRRQATAITDIRKYAVGTAKQARLQVHPFRIMLIDTSVLDELTYDAPPATRVRRKLLDLRRELRAAGANVVIFNELPPTVTDREEVLRHRSADASLVEAVVCLVKGAADADEAERFADLGARLSVWRPERLDSLDLGTDVYEWPYDDRELTDCSLGKRIFDYLTGLIDRHLVGFVAHGA